MNIDILTLYYLFSLGNIFTVLFFSFYVIIYRFKNPIVNIFIISKILYSILWVLFALRNEISWIYSIAIANIFLIFSVFYDIYCIAMANKKFNSYNFKKANLLPIVFSIVFLSVINQPTSTRIMVMSIIIFIIYIGGAIVLYLFKSSKTKIQRLSGVLCLIIAILFLFRTAWVFYEAKTVIIFTNNYFQIISYIFLFLGSFIFPMALLLVLKEKDEVKMKKDNKKKRIYIVGKASKLKNRLSNYNKTSEHEVVYYKSCKSEEDMNVIELMVINKLKEYKEKANRDRFILPIEKDITFFTDIIDKSIEFYL